MPASRHKRKRAAPAPTLTPFRLRVLQTLDDHPTGWMFADELGRLLWPGMAGPGGPRQGGPPSSAYAATNQLSRLLRPFGWVEHHKRPNGYDSAGKLEWTWWPRAWEITPTGREVLRAWYGARLEELAQTEPSYRNCFGCNGSGWICDVCGEAVPCACEEEELRGQSPCPDCAATGLASADLPAFCRSRASRIGCVWSYGHTRDCEGVPASHQLTFNGRLLLVDDHTYDDFNKVMRAAVRKWHGNEPPRPWSELLIPSA